MHKAPKNIEALVAQENLSRRSYLKILYMSCNHLPENGRDGPLYFCLRVGGGQYFSAEISFRDVSLETFA